MWGFWFVKNTAFGGRKQGAGTVFFGLFRHFVLLVWPWLQRCRGAAAGPSYLWHIIKCTLEISDQKVAFVLEFLRRVPSVKLTPAEPALVCGRAAKPAEMDTTEYLLNDPANAAFIRESREQLRRGQVVPREITELALLVSGFRA